MVTQTTGSHDEKQEWHHKMHSEWITDPNARPKTIKCSEESTGVNLHLNLGWDNSFLDMSQKKHKQPKNRLQENLKLFVLQIIMKKSERWDKEWKKISANQVSDTGLIPRIYKELSQQ